MVDAPALAPKQDMNPPISVANPRLPDLPNPHPQGPVVPSPRTVSVGRTPDPDDLAGPPLAHPIGLLEMLCAFPTLGWL